MMLGRVQVPPTVKKGEPFEVRVLVQHPMETGFRRDLDGQAIPTHIVDKLTATLGGREIFSAYVPSPRGPVFMTLIEKTFGTGVTTRTWDTVKKCAAA